MKIIEVAHLSKNYGSIQALKDVSFEVRKGELFAFLGVNGAGKSTTISILCGHLKKDDGKVLINGYDLDFDINKIKNSLGVVFQNSVLDMSLTVIDNLRYRAGLYGIAGKEFDKKIEYLSSLLDFCDLLKRTVGKLSGGQRRRIDIARALLNDPDILILDEPTTGLDPQTRNTLWNVISKLRNEKGLTVFLTTHYMEEAADADYVVILDGGEVAAEGTPLELKNEYADDFVSIYNVSEEQVKSLGLQYMILPNGYRVSVSDTIKARDLILKHPDIFTDFEIVKGKMDDVFLAVTGKKLPGGAKNG